MHILGPVLILSSNVHLGLLSDPFLVPNFITSISRCSGRPNPRLCVTFCNALFLFHGDVQSPPHPRPPNSQGAGASLVGYPPGYSLDGERQWSENYKFSFTTLFCLLLSLSISYLCLRAFRPVLRLANPPSSVFFLRKDSPRFCTRGHRTPCTKP